jgi:hypothetical protein
MFRLKNAVSWGVTSFGSCNNLPFGGTYPLHYLCKRISVQVTMLAVISVQVTMLPVISVQVTVLAVTQLNVLQLAVNANLLRTLNF